ncbi:hypothetical protein, partial [Salmonella sp. gx-f5]|uniref:hypothetical protein n=1 Tax=Salmonella sp. gx-f5 TaxID=2582605 RepID=UPI001F23191E
VSTICDDDDRIVRSNIGLLKFYLFISKKYYIKTLFLGGFSSFYMPSLNFIDKAIIVLIDTLVAFAALTQTKQSLLLASTPPA